MTHDFGAVLKEWRRTRRMSQMDLALSAGVSSRHVSFLETGRSRPSRGMVLRLCDELDVPRAARNSLLISAGMAPAYANRALSEAELKPLQDAVSWVLQQHAPYPAMALDRHWQLVAMNPTATAMLDAVGVGLNDSVIEALAGNPALRESLENLDEVIAHTLARLRTELSHFGADPVLEAAAATLQGSLRDRGHKAGREQPGLMPAVIPARYTLNGASLSFFSTIAQFGAVEDIAMSELRIEMLFPADEDTRRAVFALAGPH